MSDSIKARDWRTKLFQWELRFRSKLGLDCASCIQREINRVGGAHLPMGRFKINRPIPAGWIQGGSERLSVEHDQIIAE